MESSVAVVAAEAPDQCPRGAGADHRVQDGFNVRRVEEAEFTDEVRLFALGHLAAGANVAERPLDVGRVVVRGHQIDVRFVDRFPTQSRGSSTVDDQVVRIDPFQIGGDPPGPLGRALQLVARLPSQDRLVVPVAHAGVNVFAIEHVVDRFLKIGDQFRVGPEGVLRLAAHGGVLPAASPPLMVVDQRDDHADAQPVRLSQHHVQRAKRLFIEPPRRQHVDRHVVPLTWPAYRERVDAHDLAPDLPDGLQGIDDFERVGQPKRIGGVEAHVVLDVVQIRDIEGDEPQRLRPVEKLVAAARDEMLEDRLGGPILLAGRRRGDAQQQSSPEQNRDSTMFSHSVFLPQSTAYRTARVRERRVNSPGWHR